MLEDTEYRENGWSTGCQMIDVESSSTNIYEELGQEGFTSSVQRREVRMKYEYLYIEETGRL